MSSSSYINNTEIDLRRTAQVVVLDPPPFPKVPDEFDGRQVWGSWIGRPRDQGLTCGSCWAFATTSTLGDRLSIYTGTPIFLSVAKLLLCSFASLEYSMNPDEQSLEYIRMLERAYSGVTVCNGSTLADGWRYLYVIGTPVEQCVPETLRSDHGGPTLNELNQSPATDPLCTDFTGQYGELCTDRTPAKLYRAIGYYRLSSSDESLIRREIFLNGPVSSAMVIYPSFFTFAGFRLSVYEHTRDSEEPVAGHAVEIVGWGEDVVPYWLIKNSYGTEWGDGGYFRMIRGEDNCGIESNVLAPLPDLYLGSRRSRSFFGLSELPTDPEELMVRETYESPTAPGGGLDPMTGYYRSLYTGWPELETPDDFVIGKERPKVLGLIRYDESRQYIESGLGGGGISGWAPGLLVLFVLFLGLLVAAAILIYKRCL